MTVQIEAIHPQAVYLERLEEQFVRFDTATLNTNGPWEFKKDSIVPGFYQLVVDGQPVIRMVLADAAPCRIKLDNNLSVIQINGSPEVKALHEMEQRVEQLNLDFQKKAQVFQDSIPDENLFDVRDSILNEIDKEKVACRESLHELYTRFPESLMQLAILYQSAGNHPLYDPIQDAGLFFKTDSSLFSQYPDYEPVIDFHLKVDSLRQLKNTIALTSSGQPMPDFKLPNAWGQPVPFSNYKGKPVLVVAWSSQSKTARETTRTLLQKTRAYRRQGLEILMLSLDTDADQWKKAIREDRLPFVHVSDLKGMDSPIVQQLGIIEQPTFWLVDRSGIIQSRSKHVDEALSQLAQIIKN